MTNNCNTTEISAYVDSTALFRKLNHDLRNPLNALLATTGMLEEGIYDPLTVQQSRAVQRIDRTAQRIATILDYTVNYIKANAGQYPVTVSEFDPRQLLASVKAECLSAAQTKQIVLPLTIADSVPATVRGDETIIRRIVLELLWNAISFSPAGTIEIASEWDGEWMISIKDTGPGIPVSASSSLFEPFWRGKILGTPVPTSGSGLGLALSHAYARLMQGQLQFRRNRGKGCTFVLCVPTV